MDSFAMVRENYLPERMQMFASSVISATKYYLVDFWTAHSEPSLASFPLLNCGIWHVLLLISCYLYFTFVWGPRFMKNRPPFDLRYVMIAHNVLLVLINAGGLIAGMPNVRYGLMVLECRKLNPATSSADRTLVAIGWIFYISKYIDFLDTVYFVLRKKYSHVTGLHVFHHAIMPLLCFLFMKLSIYSNTAIIPLVNSFVHSVMYTYYALSALGPHMQKYLWWKHYLTRLQLTQFIICGVHALYMILDTSCSCPRILTFIQLSQALFFFRLFYSFYQGAYHKKINHKRIDLNANNNKENSLQSISQYVFNSQQKAQEKGACSLHECNSSEDAKAVEADESDLKKSL